jgi:hypothetical protein
VVRYDSDLNSTVAVDLVFRTRVLLCPDWCVGWQQKDDECYKENAQCGWVRQYFKEDVELMDAIENSPERFKLVVWGRRYCYVWWVLWVRVGWVRVRVRKYIYIWSASRYKFGRFLINKEVILQFFQNYNMVLVPTSSNNQIIINYY